MPIYYSGYVDDIFCVFNSLEYANMFLSFLNMLSPILKLTYEMGASKFAFLDTQISLSSNNDPPFFHAVCPWIWKNYLVKCFLRQNDRHHYSKSENFQKTEGGQIHLSFVTVL